MALARSARRASRIPVLLIAGWALLLAGWAVGNPPFAVPDEVAHYARALALTGGEALGTPTPYPGTPPAAQRRLLDRTTRWVTIPRGLATSGADCYAGDPRRSARCLDEQPHDVMATRVISYTGTYPPLPYLAPGLAARAGEGPADAVRLGRAAGALLVLALLAAAVLALWDRGRGGPALLGALAAVTPLTLFLGASMNGNGLEIAAGVATAAAILCLTRRAPAPGAVWVLAGVAGATLALTRAGGPLWLVVIALLPLGLLGPRETWRRIRGAGVAGPTVLAAWVAGVILNRVWEALYGPGVDVGLEGAGNALGLQLERYGSLLEEYVGRFGYLEVGLPVPAVVLWLLAIGVLVVLAGMVAGTRERRVLAATVVTALVLPVLLWVLAFRFTGYDLQGRYVLPVLVVVPLLAGELIARGRDVLLPRARQALLVVPIAVAVVQVVAAWWNARRSAVGTDGSLWIFDAAQWSPPTGWVPIAVVTVLGAGALAGAGVLAARSGAAAGDVRPAGES